MIKKWLTVNIRKIFLLVGQKLCPKSLSQRRDKAREKGRVLPNVSQPMSSFKSATGALSQSPLSHVKNKEEGKEGRNEGTFAKISTW